MSPAPTRKERSVFLARDEEIRHRFVVGRPSDEWLEASFIGNWFVPLTPSEADELGRKLFAERPPGARRVLRRPLRLPAEVRGRAST